MTEKLKFRLAKMDDIEKLVDINTGNEHKYRSVNFRMFRQLIPKNLVMVCELDEIVVGLLYWNSEFLDRTDSFYLSQITIDKEYRSKGYGVLLLKYFLKYAKKKGAKKVFALVEDKNKASLSTCYKAGGIKSGILLGFGKQKKRIIIRFESG